MVQTLVSGDVEVFIDNRLIPHETVEYELPTVDISRRPTCKVTIPNHDGSWTGRVTAGDNVRVERNGLVDFRGIVEPWGYSKDQSSGNLLTFRAKHETSSLLEGYLCDTYDFDENDSGLADAVVNPWEFRIFRDVDSAINDIGQHGAVHGWRPDQVIRAVIGTSLLHQNFHNEGKFYLASSFGGGSGIGIYTDKGAGQETPHLQLTLTGDGTYSTTGNVESIPILSGDPNLSPMGDVSDVTVTIYGERYSANDPTIEVCRNATAGTRTYKTASLDSFTADESGTLDRWTYSVDLSSDGASITNELGYKVSLSGDGGGTTAIQYVAIEATVTTETGVTEGIIAEYDDQSGSDAGNTLDDGRNLVEVSVAGKNRLEALADIRGLTVSRASLNPSPHWDIRLNSDLSVSFDERLGEDRPRVYSFEEDGGNLINLGHDFEGDQIFYQVMALGAGSGIARNKIVSNKPFDEGGLYFPSLDPDVGAKYGNAANEGVFEDSNIKDLTNLLRRARAFAKLHSEAISTYTVKVNSEYADPFTTFDSIRLDDPDTETHGDPVRVVAKTIRLDSNGKETWNLEIGHPQVNIADTAKQLSGQIQATNITTQPEVIKTTSSNEKVSFTNSDHGFFDFEVDDPQKNDRWLLTLSTREWVIDSQGSDTSEGGTIGSDGSSIISVSTTTQSSSAVAAGSEVSHAHTIPTMDSNGGVAVVRLKYPSESVDEIMAGVGVEVDDGGGTTLPLVDQAVLTNDGEWQQTVVIPSPFEGGTLNVDLENHSLSSKDMDSEVEFYKFSDHDHTGEGTTAPPVFGQWVFDGDDGDGTGNAIYGTGIEFWVDPDNLDTQGNPTDSSRGKADLAFGSQSSTVALERIDITHLLEKDANDVVKRGTHDIRFLSTTSTSPNTQGLAALSVSITKVNQVQGGS